MMFRLITSLECFLSVHKIMPENYHNTWVRSDRTLCLHQFESFRTDSTGWKFLNVSLTEFGHFWTLSKYVWTDRLNIMRTKGISLIYYKPKRSSIIAKPALHKFHSFSICRFLGIAFRLKGSVIDQAVQEVLFGWLAVV